MSRKFITGVLAVAATVTALTAAPARAADPDDVARFIGAATTLFILGKIIESHRDDTKATISTRHAPQQHRPKAVNRGKPPLPASCVWRVGQNKHRRVLGQYCLHKTYHASSRLPQSCRVHVHYKGKSRNAFGLRCLETKGYRVAGRH